MEPFIKLGESGATILEIAFRAVYRGSKVEKHAQRLKRLAFEQTEFSNSGHKVEVFVTRTT